MANNVDTRKDFSVRYNEQVECVTIFMSEAGDQLFLVVTQQNIMNLNIDFVVCAWSGPVEITT